MNLQTASLIIHGLQYFTSMLVATKMRHCDENYFMHSSGGVKERQPYELVNCSMHQYIVHVFVS